MQPNDPLTPPATPQAPPTPSVPQAPPVPFQNTTAAQTSESVQPSEQIINQPPQEVKKKSKRPLIFILAAILVLIIAAITLGFVQSNKADAAAEGYKEKVLQNVEAIRKGPEYEDRIKLINNKVAALPNVWLGELLSSDYKEAADVERRYDALLDETTPFFKEVYMFFELPDLIEEFKNVVTTPFEGSTAELEVYTASIRDKAEKYASIADRLDSYYFDEKYAASKEKAVKNIQTMSETYKKMAEIRSTQGDVNSELAPLNEQYVKNYGEARTFFQKDAVTYYDELAERLSGEADATDDKFEAFIDSLK